MKRIGILGGTFNPIHNGHLYIAAEAYRQLHLDQVWIMPDGIPPHKNLEGGVTRFERVGMCEAAVNSIPYMRVIHTEQKSDGKSFSYLTLTQMKKDYPDDELYFIIGEDSLDTFPTWVHPEIIAKSVTLAVSVRHDSDVTNDIEAVSMDLKKRYGANIELLSTDYIDISSSDIRELIASGITPKNIVKLKLMVPAPVFSYIMAHRLYGSTKGLKMSPKKEIKSTDFPKLKQEIEKKLEKKLKPSRYTHTQGVAYTAAALAMAHCYPMDVAFIAGLLHDCAKYMSPDELYDFCKKKNIDISPAEEKSPQLLHAKAGAYLARTEYGIEDPDILHAITVHTTGMPGMNLLDEILFTADYIEPNRDKAARLTEIRQCAFKDFHLAIQMILSDTIDYLKATGKDIDETTYRTYEYYKNL
ncbi:MAG: nicotinate (nicotinamide) nucleotide adenylyltransferase [Lachnospiraceae bacterium]|uniref:Probable nicotinate-nucleotide adenylyltransferase n=1 Tax=Candidatus Weimeria bifida TaxID=2599074 RepID=A0A6N7J1N2_9FIRM|nr:nicotinate (nicotinamide) nucleotide adenylyltransferase [Candidatus Weimeria bifida]RRF96987.1 MAG: nicotinate (nicotinamide) nucleotide adenylyltransferase [Lachnospiraceae bacterium]